jgi:F-type H+-transporting ATPase subunit epsilon
MAEKALRVEIVTPYEMFFEGQVEMVVVTCKDGEIGVLKGHTPLIAALTPGEIRLLANGKWQVAVATNGYAEIGPELTIIVVNAAEWPDQIDVPRAKNALERAEARLKDPKLSLLEKTHARHSVARANARLKVADKFHRGLFKS